MGREPGRSGGGREREAGEQGAGSGSRNKKAIVCCLLLGIIQSKYSSSKLLKFPLNIHQCLKENFGGKKTYICTRAGKTALLPVNLEIPSI